MPNPNNLTSSIDKAKQQREHELAERRRRLEERAKKEAAAANAAIIPIQQATGAQLAAGAQPTGTEPTGEAPAAGRMPAGAQPAGGNARRMPQAVPPAAPEPAASTIPTGKEPAAGTVPMGAAPAAGKEPVPLTVEWKKGELRLPNWLVFNFFPLLKLDERAVYEELYLWTHGFGENPRVVSQKKVAARLGIDEKRLQRIVGKLEVKGFVRRIEGKHAGPMGERGTLFDVRLPHVTGAPPATGAQPAAGGRPAAGARAAASAAPDMKIMKAKEETAAADAAPSIYEIRTIGARLFERHRNDLGFDHERLAELVADALAAQGITPNADLIEEAIKGMAV